MSLWDFGLRISDCGFGARRHLAQTCVFRLTPDPRPLPLITAPQAPIPSPQC